MVEDKSTTPFGARPAASIMPERRGAERLSSNLRLICYPTTSGLLERRPARLRNVSRTGLGLHVDRRWAPGTDLMVELPDLATRKPRPVRARVIHATPQIGGCFLIGCMLETALSEEEVQALVSSS